MQVTYTDGTQVHEGDAIRYHQAPGGLMAPGPWMEGVAALYPHDAAHRAHMLASGWQDPDELHLLDARGRYYHLGGHVIERI